MRRSLAGVVFFLAASSGLADPGASSALARAVELYRTGRLSEALLGMVDVLERDPENAAAKSYVWTIARRMRDQARRADFSDEETAAAVRRAHELIEIRRRRSSEMLDRLREARDRSRGAKAADDLLFAAQNIEGAGDVEFESERARAEADSHLQAVIANISAALERGAFAARKDHLSAEAVLAHSRGDWAGAAAKWEDALKEAPTDENIRRNLAQVKELISRKEREKKLGDLRAQAETFQRTGFMRQAAAAWKQVLEIVPKDAEALENLPLCRKSVEREERGREVKALTAEGVSLYEAGKLSEALERWLKALQLDPAHEQARVWISHVGKRLEEAPDAAASPRTLNQSPAQAGSAPEKPSPGGRRKALDLYRQGLLYYAGNDIEKAIGAWKESLRLDPSLVQAQQALRQAQAELKYVE